MVLRKANGYYDPTAKGFELITILPGAYLSEIPLMMGGFLKILHTCEGVIEEKVSVYEVLSNNSVVSSNSKDIIKYATEHGLDDKDSIPIKYLFTSNLKVLLIEERENE